jgi:hypothetical protein
MNSTILSNSVIGNDKIIINTIIAPEVIELEIVLISLFLFSLLLFILSFFIKDPNKELRKEFDQFSMQQFQEVYQIKKKLKVLEEELLVNDIDFSPTLSSFTKVEKMEVHDIIKNQVWSLCKQGIPIEQIAKQSSLTVDEVQMIIKEFTFKD